MIVTILVSSRLAEAMLRTWANTVSIRPITIILPDFLKVLFLLVRGKPPMAIRMNASMSLNMSKYTFPIFIISCNESNKIPAQTREIFFLAYCNTLPIMLQ